MKKKVLFLIFILALSSVSALELTLKDEFYLGETLIAKLEGNILEKIPIENIGFYRDHVEVPITFDRIEIDNTYYIYAILPYNSRNYTLRIKDVSFQEFNQVKTQDIEKKFFIKNQTAEFSVEPGFFFTDKNLSLNIRNNLNNELKITSILGNSTQEFSIPRYETKQIIIDIKGVNSTRKEVVEIKSSSGFSYELPAYIIVYSSSTGTNGGLNGDTDPDPEPTPGEERERIRFDYSSFEATINRGQAINSNFSLVNLGNADAKNINLTISDNLKDYIKLSKQQLDLKEGEATIIFFTANFTSLGNFTGTITATSANSSSTLLMKFSVQQNATTNISRTTIQTKTCEELDGLICPNYVCYGGRLEQSSNGLCCVGGTCEPQAETRERNWTATIIVVLLLAVIGFFIWKKLKSNNPEARDILKKRSENFSKKYETSGSLTRD